MASTKANVIELHPRAADSYRAIVAKIKDIAKMDGSEAAEAKAALRDLIVEIVISPAPKGQPLGIEVLGDIMPLLNGGAKMRAAITDNAARVAVVV